MPDDRDQEKEAKAKRRAALRRASAKKKRAERKKVLESGGGAKDDTPKKSKRKRQTESKRRAESTKKRSPRRRTADRDVEDRPKRSRRRAAPASSRRQRKERRPESEAMGELVEPSKPPEPELDLTGDLNPAWELGLFLGGGFCLASVGLAVASLLTASGQIDSLTVVGLVLLLMAIAAGGVGVLARKIWGYIIGIGSSALGAFAGLLWGMYAVVTPDMNPWLPLFFFLSNLLAVLALYQMRWGPGPMADERDRYRAIKRNLSSYTTSHGELSHSAAFAAIVASLMGVAMLLGAYSEEAPDTSMPPNFTDGMDLEELSEPPTEGNIVLARWGNEDYFFLGRVDQRRGDDEFHITYLDGDEAWVRLRDLRQDAVRPNASVHIHVQGHEGWLPAQITQRANNRVEADIGPQRVWVPLAMVRVRELS